MAIHTAKKPRAIVVGVGMIGRVHIGTLRRNNVDVVSVVASAPERSEAAAQEFLVPRGDPNLTTALAEAEADVVHICTPNVHHYQMAREALAAGKHVVCEKPLTLTADQAADLFQRASESGLVHAVCFNNRFYPLVQEIAARQRSGGLGRAFLIRASSADDTLWSDSDSDWRLDPSMGGTSVVTATTGSHLLDLTSFVLGTRVAAVCADFATVHPIRRPPEDATGKVEDIISDAEEIANLLVRYESGARGVLSLSHVAAGHPYRIRIEIDASEYGLGWDSERPNELWVGHRDQPNEIVIADPRQVSPESRRYVPNPGAYREGFSETFRLLFSQVYRQIASATEDGSAPDFPTFEAGYAGLLVHESVMRSAHEQCWVEIDWTVLDKQAVGATSG